MSPSTRLFSWWATLAGGGLCGQDAAGLRFAKWQDRQRRWIRAWRVTFLQSRQVFWSG